MNMKIAKQVAGLISRAQSILIIQAENPDGDSLGSALALEQIFGDMDKKTQLYCPVQMPTYLRYMEGWSRVMDELPASFDLSIIVDTSSASLLERVLTPVNISKLSRQPIVVLDHHAVDNDIPLETICLNQPSFVATGELIYELAKLNSWALNAVARESLAYSILADSLGLMSQGTSANTIHAIGDLVAQGVELSVLDQRRRQFNKKSEDIFRYKGQLFERVEFHLDDRLGLVVIPWEEIQQYSDAYNPSMLILDEIRMVENVQLATAFKIYPDGKITGKLRANSGVLNANAIAEVFGGGGHPYAAGFKTRGRDFVDLKKEFLKVVGEQLALGTNES